MYISMWYQDHESVVLASSLSSSVKFGGCTLSQVDLSLLQLHIFVPGRLFPGHLHAAEHRFFKHEHFINFTRNSRTHGSSYMTVLNISSFKDYSCPTGSSSLFLDHTSA